MPKISQIGRGGGQKLNRLRRKVGAVLIEFAFAIPVFLVLIYYIHDLPKQKSMQRKMQFVANEVSAILQNISRQKSTPITKQDMMNATRLAYLTIYPGTTILNSALGYMPHTWTYYVVCTGKNQAQMKWGSATWVTNINRADTWYKQHPGSTIHYYSSSTNCENIYPDLYLLDGERKIILECSLYNSIANPRRAFNFLLFTPIPKDSIKQNWFRGITIFTPIDGAFSETPPQ